MFFDRLIALSVLTLLAVGGTAIYGTIAWSEQGGCGVAKSLGGSRVSKLTDDAGHRKLINVVEELAIASGSPVPTVYVLEGEPGINAFTVGVDAKHAVIGVTQGAVQRLKRHQLQGDLLQGTMQEQSGKLRQRQLSARNVKWSIRKSVVLTWQ